MFIGRKEQLRLLEDRYRSRTSEFCVLYGRRRIGKSRLLEEFARDKPSFFYLAGRENKRQALRRFVRELGEALGDPLTGKVTLSEWDEALTLLDRSIPGLLKGRNGRKAVVVLDEFQWMCRGAPELLSDLQRFWDRGWKDTGKVFLVVCGSAISFMLGEVLSRKSPLFGRRTFSFELGAFKAPEVRAFLPGKNIFEMAEAYMAVGGVPKYLEILSSRDSFQRIMRREAFSASGYLFDEIRFVLSEQLKETEHYFLLLEQMAHGARGVAQLERATGIASGQIMYYLERLQLLGFVSRHTPLGEGTRTKKVRYRLDDYYLRFYFTFIHPNRERISSSQPGIPFDRIAGSRWESYMGISFEHLVRDHADTVAAVLGHEGEIRQVGSFWQLPTKRRRGIQIDLLIECHDRTTLLCECKWSRGKVGKEVLAELRKRAQGYPNVKGDTIRPVLVAAGGVTDAVRQDRDISILTLKDFF